MIDKENRVEVTDGRKTRWIRPDEIAEYANIGYSPVESQEVQVKLQPRKKSVEPTVAVELPQETPTTEEPLNG
jgi:hypothetical protein